MGVYGRLLSVQAVFGQLHLERLSKASGTKRRTELEMNRAPTYERDLVTNMPRPRGFVDGSISRERQGRTGACITRV